MKKFAVISGFLGSGKTSLMMALTKYCSGHYGKAAMISNDLGEGVLLADHKLALLSGCRAAQITNECICFCHDVLADKLNAFYDEGCVLVVSDIPGFGVGALEHVYHGLTEDHPGQFDLAPFTVLIEPHNAKLLRKEQDGDMGNILDSQLKEADLIVLNKSDLLNAAECEEESSWLARHYPLADVIPVSALTGENLDSLCLALLNGQASLRHPDIDYDADDLQNEIVSLSEYYLQYRALVCCSDFDGNEYLTDLAEEIRSAVSGSDNELPHFKLLAWDPEGDFGKADILGTGRPIELPHRFSRRCTDIAVILNTSAACPDETLDRIIDDAVKSVSEKYQLELTVFKKDHFGLGE